MYFQLKNKGELEG
jgi:hypothetical protein